MALERGSNYKMKFAINFFLLNVYYPIHYSLIILLAVASKLRAEGNLMKFQR